MRISSSDVVISQQRQWEQAKDSLNLTAIGKGDPNDLNSVQALTEDDITEMAEDHIQSNELELEKPFDASKEALVQHVTSDIHKDTVDISSASLITNKEGDSALLSHQATIESISQKIVEQNLLVREVQQGEAEPTDVIGVQVLHFEKTESHLSVTMEALGTVQTEDGRQIDFAMALDFQRNSVQQINSEFIGDRKLIDPLMINLQGNSIAMSDARFSFDLNVDGRSELIAKPADGTGFLVFDKNGNGEIDNGSELFGPQSGSGFAELAALDSDGNGWLDENDQAYGQLQVMTFNGEEVQLQSLKKAGVGAIFTGSVEAGYELKSTTGDDLGQVANTGFALSEQGQALFVQEFHFADLGLNTFYQAPNRNPLEVFQSDEAIIAERPETLVMLDNIESKTQDERIMPSYFPLEMLVQPMFEHSPFVPTGEVSEGGNAIYRFDPGTPEWQQDHILTPNHQEIQFSFSESYFQHSYTREANTAAHESIIDRNEKDIDEDWRAPEAKQYSVAEELAASDELKQAKEKSGRWQELKFLIEEMRTQTEAMQASKNKLKAYC